MWTDCQGVGEGGEAVVDGEDYGSEEGCGVVEVESECCYWNHEVTRSLSSRSVRFLDVCPHKTVTDGNFFDKICRSSPEFSIHRLFF